MATLCPCLKNLPEAKVNRFQLTALTKEVSKKPSTDFVLWFDLMKSVLIKHSKEKYKMYGSNNEGAPESEIELNPVYKEIDRLREWWSQGKIPPS